MKSGALHHPRFPNIPIWLRITGVERKEMGVTDNTGRIPANTKFNWKPYMADIVSMLEYGLEPPDIARKLDIPQKIMSAKCARMITSGQVIPGNKEK